MAGSDIDPPTFPGFPSRSFAGTRSVAVMGLYESPVEENGLEPPVPVSRRATRTTFDDTSCVVDEDALSNCTVETQRRRPAPFGVGRRSPLPRPDRKADSRELLREQNLAQSDTRSRILYVKRPLKDLAEYQEYACVYPLAAALRRRLAIGRGRWQGGGGGLRIPGLGGPGPRAATATGKIPWRTRSCTR